MAIVCRRRSTLHPLAGRSTAEDGGGATFLPREEWAKPRGRKSLRRRCGSGDRGAAVLRLDQAKERQWVARRTASSREVVANLKGPAQEGWHTGRREGGRGVEKGRHRLSPTGRRQRASPASCRLRQRDETIEAPSSRAATTSRSGATIRASTSPFSPTCSMRATQRASVTLVAQPPVVRRVGAPGTLSARRRDKKRQTREGRAARDNSADHGKCRLPATAGHADAGQGKRNLIAGDRCRHAVDQTDNGADQRRARAGDRQLRAHR